MREAVACFIFVLLFDNYMHIYMAQGNVFVA